MIDIDGIEGAAPQASDILDSPPPLSYLRPRDARHTGRIFAKNKGELSPAMRQYQQFKSQYPGYILFFRMGDFYEMFWDDAKLGRPSAGRCADQPQPGLDAEDAIPMAGVPFQAVESYLRKDDRRGAQSRDLRADGGPGQAKGVIQREVVRLMTPGTLTDDPLLDGRADNFLAAVAFQLTKNNGYRAALAWVELSTGACVAMSGSEGQVLDEIARLRPAEILVPEHASGQPHEIGQRIQALGQQCDHRPAGLAVHAASRRASKCRSSGRLAPPAGIRI